MYNKFIDLKKYLLLVSPHEQIYEIDRFINYITKSNRKKLLIKFRMRTKIRLIRQQIIKLLHWTVLF